jgi:hypothetical protein
LSSGRRRYNIFDISEIENNFNPKKKLMLMATLNPQKTEKVKSELDITSPKKNMLDRPSTTYQRKLRPLTGMTNLFDTSKISNKQNHTINARPYSTYSAFNNPNKSTNLNMKEKENVEIEDKDTIESNKLS